jgi:hypothetical protein
VAAPGYSRHMTVMAASVGGAILIVLVLIVVFVGHGICAHAPRQRDRRAPPPGPRSGSARRGLSAEQLTGEPLTEPEQKVSAPELFFDLVFVSALTQVTARMRVAS